MLRLGLFITLIGSYSLVFCATGSITGRVADESTQEALPQANVIVLETTKGAATDEEGYFRIRELDPGVYNIKFSMIGYKTIIKNRITVKPGVSTFLRVELKEEPIQMKGITVKASFFEKTKDAVVSSKKDGF
ncbi:MAG: carboxypeptidase-like regulatory domain-containing protein [candidate division WOR-3 bacterium]|nr:carboxypeptidase-like regulatory domain-containing protein [candidate division WOR-3 bacterium]